MNNVREGDQLTVALRAILGTRDRETLGCAGGLAERGGHSVGGEGVAGESAGTSVLSAASSSPDGRAGARGSADRCRRARHCGRVSGDHELDSVGSTARLER